MSFWTDAAAEGWVYCSNSRSKVCVKYAGPMELWNDAPVTPYEGQSGRRLSHLRLSANTVMLRTACFLCVIGHRELLMKEPVSKPMSRSHNGGGRKSDSILTSGCRRKRLPKSAEGSTQTKQRLSSACRTLLSLLPIRPLLTLPKSISIIILCLVL